jgi:hypothetical protein
MCTPLNAYSMQLARSHREQQVAAAERSRIAAQIRAPGRRWIASFFPRLRLQELDPGTTPRDGASPPINYPIRTRRVAQP